MNNNQNQLQNQSPIQKPNDITMDLVNLQQKYSNLLTKYKASVANYMNYLNQEVTTGTSFVTLQGLAYNGTGTAGESTATTIQDCEASCANAKNCSGATFVSNQCIIRTGDSPLVTSTPSSYAIIPKGKQLLLNMEDLNTQLISTNTELTNKIKQSNPKYVENINENKTKTQELVKNYAKLLEERTNIAELLNEYESLDNAEKENQIVITQNYYTYILLLVISIAFIFIIYRFLSSSGSAPQTIQYGGDLGSNAYYIVIGILALVIVIHIIKKFSH
jgi:hypothetical protein